MRFAHLADCHIGGWREPELRELSIESFRKAMDICISRKMDFILIAGDLFDSAMPAIELIKEVTGLLKTLKDSGINTYIVAGSHDFSASGKTMIDVLEKAGLVYNVVKFDANGKLQYVLDKSGVKIAGYLGKKSGLEQKDYLNLDFKHLENLDGYKIFMFHSGIDEIKPEEMRQIEMLGRELLPKNFDYYAGGHIHYMFSKDKIYFPGPIFPNNFKELCDLKHGGFVIVEDGKAETVELKLKDVACLNIDVNGKCSEEAEKIINEKLSEDFNDKILCLRVAGILSSGKPSDIKFADSNAYCFLRNTSKLSTKEFVQEKIDFDASDIEQIEDKLIDEHKEQFNVDESVVKKLIDALAAEKLEGERNSDFEKRLMKGVLNVFK